MAHVISFSTARFDVAAETPNPINPIFGKSVLDWIRQTLEGTAYKASEPDTEDWGWYMSVDGNGASYMVGASGQPEDGASEIEWIIQVHRPRSFTDRLAGRNRLMDDDPFVALLEGIVRREPAFHDVSVERGP